MLVLGEPAAALRERDTRASTDDGGVAVEIVAREGIDSAVGGGANGCTWTASRYPYQGTEPPARFGSPPSPEHELYLIFCDGEYVSTEWLGPRETVEVTGREVADRVLRQVLVDQVGIGVRPEARGVTGLPSLFWVDRYRGEAIAASVNELGVSVDVEIAFRSATWDFGDGTPAVEGLGEPWPERSRVRHAYQHRGDRTITVTLVLDPRYRVDGGEWQPLPSITRTASLAYVVDEVQAVRDR